MTRFAILTLVMGATAQSTTSGYQCTTCSMERDANDTFAIYTGRADPDVFPRINVSGPVMELLLRFNAASQDIRILNGTHAYFPFHQSFQAYFTRQTHALDELESGVAILKLTNTPVSVIGKKTPVMFAEKLHTFYQEGHCNDQASIRHEKERKTRSAEDEAYARSAQGRHAKALAETTEVMATGSGFQGVIGSQDAHHQDALFSWAAQTSEFKSVDARARLTEHQAGIEDVVREKAKLKGDSAIKNNVNCFHFEDGFGVNVDSQGAAFPLDRPVVSHRGQTQYYPTEEFQFVTGFTTVHYDEQTGVVEVYQLASAMLHRDDDLDNDAFYVGPADGDKQPISQGRGRVEPNLGQPGPYAADMLPGDYTMFVDPETVCPKATYDALDTRLATYTKVHLITSGSFSTATWDLQMKDMNDTAALRAGTNCQDQVCRDVVDSYSCMADYLKAPQGNVPKGMNPVAMNLFVVTATMHGLVEVEAENRLKVLGARDFNTFTAEPNHGVSANATVPGTCQDVERCQLEIGAEYLGEGEEADIKKILADRRKEYEAQLPNQVFRGQHAKTNGCARAKWVANPDVPQELAYGVFKPGSEYNAWVRFSNGAQVPNDDRDRDIRGFSVKLLGVAGERVKRPAERGVIMSEDTTQDFTLISTGGEDTSTSRNAMFNRNLKDYHMVRENGIFSVLGACPDCMANVLELTAKAAVRNPLALLYGSLTPHILEMPNGQKRGFKAIVKPCDLNATIEKETKSSFVAVGGGDDNPHFQRDTLAAQLDPKRAGNGPVCMEFGMQMQKDACAMPIEKPEKPWNAETVWVAKLWFEPQKITGAFQMAMCENMPFNPWHSLQVHRPAGATNRARLEVYHQLALDRARLNDETMVTDTSLKCGTDMPAKATCPFSGGNKNTGPGLAGDPFVTDPNGNKVQIYLPLGKRMKLLKCGGTELSGRAFGIGSGADHQQWFDEFAITVDGKEEVLVGLRSDAHNATHNVSTPLLKAENGKAAQGNVDLKIIKAKVMGVPVTKTGTVLTESDHLVSIWGTEKSETLQLTTGRTTIQIESAHAKKFAAEALQKMNTHLDLQFVELNKEDCNEGVLAEVWGNAPMSQQTAAMLKPPM